MILLVAGCVGVYAAGEKSDDVRSRFAMAALAARSKPGMGPWARWISNPLLRVGYVAGRFKKQQRPPVTRIADDFSAFAADRDFDDVEVEQSDEMQQIKRQVDDYGHMRFGKRDFDDYGHMRFGR